MGTVIKKKKFVMVYMADYDPENFNKQVEDLIDEGYELNGDTVITPSAIFYEYRHNEDKLMTLKATRTSFYYQQSMKLKQ